MSRLASRIPAFSLLVVVLVIALVPAAALASDGSDPRPTSYVLPEVQSGEGVYPEGIAFDPATGNFYVSSTGFVGGPGGGAIYRGNLDSPTTEVFLPGGADGRTFSAGVEVAGGRLFVAGAPTGKMFVYDLATKGLIASFSDGRAATFVNDVAVDLDGNAYFTESAAASPVLYRLARAGAGYTFSEWLDFTGTPFVYQAGFNANGISATPDGKYLLVVQSNTGKLFRITIATKEVIEIGLGGTSLSNGDGIELRGHTLYVVRNQNETIAEVLLSGDYSSGTVVAQHDFSATLAFPTTAVRAAGRLLVVNSQFDRLPPASPVLPFTVSSLKLP